MQARLIKNDQGLWLLFNNGQMKQANKEDLRNLLCSFKLIRCLTSRANKDENAKRWDIDCLEMSDYPGETIAHVTDGFQLVLFDFKEFEVLFKTNYFVIQNDCVTIAEYAKKYNKSVEQIKVFCRTGRIPGAQKIAGSWMIPCDASYPPDNRFKKRKI